MGGLVVGVWVDGCLCRVEKQVAGRIMGVCDRRMPKLRCFRLRRENYSVAYDILNCTNHCSRRAWDVYRGVAEWLPPFGMRPGW